MAKSKSKTKTMTADERAAKDPAWLQKALASPGLRSKLSDKFLPPDLLAKRKANEAAKKERAFYANLGDVTKPLTGETAVRYVDTVVDRAYKPQEDAYAAQRKETINSGMSQANWSQDYDNYLKGISDASLTAQQTAGANQLTATQNARRDLLTDIDNLQTRAQAAQAADANVRGQGYGGGSEGMIAEQIAEAKTRASLQGNTQEESARAATGANEAYMRALQGVQGLKGREAQDAIRTSTDNTVKKVDAALADLVGKKADKKIETLGDLRQTERKNYIYEVGVNNQMQQAILNAKTKMAEIKSEAALAREKNALELQLKQMGIDADAAIKMAEIAAADARSAADNRTKLQVAGINNKGGGSKNKAAAEEYRAGIRTLYAALSGNKNYMTLVKMPGGKGLSAFTAAAKREYPKMADSQIRAAWDLLGANRLSRVSQGAFKSKGYGVPKGTWWK